MGASFMKITWRAVFWMAASAAFGQGITPHSCDVIVVGATSAGVGAALSAGRLGMRVAVIEETPTLGGMLANGLSNTDLRSPGGSSGLFDEFRLRVGKYYREKFPNDPVMKTVPYAQMGFRYEPHMADRIFKQMVAEVPSIRVFYRRYAVAVRKQGNRVTGVITRDLAGRNEITFLAPVTIDATHEGDLLPLAGAAFRLGREPRSAEEPHAGKIYMTWSGHLFGSGEGDNKLQAYAMLLTIKDYGSGADKTIPRPPGYNPANYAPERRDTTFWHLGGMLPNRKFEVNENLDGTDVAEINWNYIQGDRAARRRIWEKYRDHALGYLYFRQTVMGEKHLGLAEDEFQDNNHLPYILYVREGRRLEGVSMLTERDVIRVPGSPRPPLQRDSIAVGDWEIDSHAVSRDTEGYIFLHAVSDKYKLSAPYQAPYRILVPKQVDGLLAPMAVAATHVAFQVLRLEPIRVSMGQAAGIAAALCVKQRIQPRQVDPARLQEMLLEQGSAIFYYKDVPPSHPQFRTIQRLSMAGVVRGDDDFRFRPDEQATKAEVASMLFHGLNLKVKLDYSQLFQVMRWNRHNQFCTPDHWGTYYLMTLFNLGAFGKAELAKLEPDAKATRREMVAWSARALGVAAAAHPALSAEAKKAAGPVTLAQVCALVERLRAPSPR